MILVNGQQTNTISVSDRAFQYGDGCFTTLLITDGVVNAWALHLSRLQSNTRALRIDGVDWVGLISWVEQTAGKLASKPHAVMKVIITRGVGGRGYSPANCGAPTVVISTHIYPKHYAQWRKHGVNMILLERQLGLSSLGGIKHLNRLEQVLFKREIEASHADDGVACDLNGFLVEASASNIFWRKGNVLFTPKIEAAGVAGTMRIQVIEAAMENYDVQFIRAKADVLWDADEMFITNSVIRLASARRLNSKIFTSVDACKAINLRLNA